MLACGAGCEVMLGLVGAALAALGAVALGTVVLVVVGAVALGALE
jgi:hypothetical protein